MNLSNYRQITRPPFTWGHSSKARIIRAIYNWF